MAFNFGKKSDSVVVYDDGSYEVADFIEVVGRGGDVFVTFYHCKKSAESKAGARVEDLYEVLGQAVKSTAWAYARERLFRRLQERAHRSPCLNGDMKKLETLLMSKFAPDYYDVVVVQPGLSKAKLSDEKLDPRVRTLLAATADYVTGSGRCRSFLIMSSD